MPLHSLKITDIINHSVDNKTTSLQNLATILGFIGLSKENIQELINELSHISSSEAIVYNAENVEKFATLINNIIATNKGLTDLQINSLIDIVFSICNTYNDLVEHDQQICYSIFELLNHAHLNELHINKILNFKDLQQIVARVDCAKVSFANLINAIIDNNKYLTNHHIDSLLDAVLSVYKG